MLLDAAEADAGIGQRETGLHAYAGAETDADTANFGGGDVIGLVCPLAADGRVERAEVTETHRFAVNDGAENVLLHGRKHSLHIVSRNRTLPADGIGQSFKANRRYGGPVEHNTSLPWSWDSFWLLLCNSSWLFFSFKG